LNGKTKLFKPFAMVITRKEEWLNKLAQLEEDCTKVLDYVEENNEKGTKKYSWPNIISKLGLPEIFNT
jgi:hypothetical protein